MVSTTGAEAVENAVRIAKASTGRQNIILQAGTTAAGGDARADAEQDGVRRRQLPARGGLLSAPFPYETQSPGLGTDGALYQLDLVLKQQTPPADTAAIIIGPCSARAATSPRRPPSSGLREPRRARDTAHL